MGYTKGEWEIWRHGLTSQIRVGDYKIAEGIYRKANAYLIAASPRMIEFIRKLASEGNKEAAEFLQTLKL